MSRVRKLALCALLMAMDIIFARFLSVTPGGLSRISLQFLPDAMMGLLLGPLWAAAGCASADVLGMALNSAGLAFNPLFTLSAAVRGCLYGICLGRLKISFPKRALLAVAAVAIVVDLGLNPVWLSLYYGNLTYGGVLATKALTEAVVLPVRYILLLLVGRYLLPALRKIIPTGGEY